MFGQSRKEKKRVPMVKIIERFESDVQNSLEFWKRNLDPDFIKFLCLKFHNIGSKRMNRFETGDSRFLMQVFQVPGKNQYFNPFEDTWIKPGDGHIFMQAVSGINLIGKREKGMLQLKNEYLQIVLRKYMKNTKVKMSIIIFWLMRNYSFKDAADGELLFEAKKQFTKEFHFDKREISNLFNDDIPVLKSTTGYEAEFTQDEVVDVVANGRDGDLVEPILEEMPIDTRSSSQPLQGKEDLVDSTSNREAEKGTMKEIELPDNPFALLIQIERDSRREKGKREIENKNVRALIEKAMNLFKERKQIILTGPPGTGKTYFATMIANQLTDFDDSRVKTIQFHPEYTYENFIECQRMKSGWELEHIPQVFRVSCNQACDSINQWLKARYREVAGKQEGFKDSFETWLKNQYANGLDKEIEENCPKHVLIIDEINRGDLSRILGEAIFGLEYRDRPIKTMYFPAEEALIIPSNLYIIGTMNSNDKSIALVDFALRRRFTFLKVLPDRSILESWLNAHESPIKDEVLHLYDILNEPENGWIEKTWSGDTEACENFKLGHTFFFKTTKESMMLEWEHSIIPLLFEYMNYSSEKMDSFKSEFDLKDPFKQSGGSKD